MDFGYFRLISPQVRQKCTCHACIAALGHVWPRLAASGHILSNVLPDVCSMVEHGHKSQEWSNYDHVQLDQRTITMLDHLWYVDATGLYNISIAQYE